jgi:hypothetical protein
MNIWQDEWHKMWHEIGKWSWYLGASTNRKPPKSYTELVNENNTLKEHIVLLKKELNTYKRNI